MLTSAHLALIFTAAAIGIAFLSLKLQWWASRDPGATFLPEIVAALLIFDSHGQRSAHQLALGLIAAFVLIGLWLTIWKPLWLRSRPSALAAIGLRKLLRPGPLLFLVTAAALLPQVASRNQVLLAFGLLFFGMAILRYLKPRLVVFLSWTGLLLCVGGYALPGFFFPLLLSPYDPVWVEMHLTATIGVADGLAAGQKIFEDVQPRYGLLIPTLFAVGEKFFGPVSAAGYLRGIQVLQLLFALLALGGYFLWRPKHPWMWIAPLLLFLPWLHNFHPALFHPNQSGWRFIGFPVGICLLLLAGRSRSRWMPYVVGLSSGLVLLINWETGIALSLGFLVFVLSRVEFKNVPGLCGQSLKLIAGTLLSFLLFGGIFFSAFGHFPLPTSLEAVGMQIRNFSSGMGGTEFFKDLMALLIFVHSAFVFLQGGLLWGKGPLSFGRGFKTAIAAIILVWFAYYANRPHPWNLWSYLFLYGFLIAEYFDPRWLKWKPKRLLRLSLPLPLLMLGIVLVPYTLSANKTALREILATKKRVEESAAAAAFGEVSGLLADAAYTEMVTRKSAYLAGLENRDEILYFTVNSYFVPRFSGHYSRSFFPRDPFSVAVTFRKFDALVDRTLERLPAFILFDAPEDPVLKKLATYHMNLFYRRLRKELAGHYHLLKTEEGWEVWERNVGAVRPSAR